MGSSRGSLLAAALLFISPLFCADSALVFHKTFVGSGSDNVTAIATDPAGYVIAAGVTGSYDFPVTDGSRNSATHFAASSDDGSTWRPLSNLTPRGPVTLVVDTSTPPVWYATSAEGFVFKSIDGGATWNDTSPRGVPGCAADHSDCAVFSLAINPAQPAVIYARSDAGIFKSTDAGATWFRLPPPAVDPNPPSYLVLDPFHPDHVFTRAANSHFRSFDGGATWTQYTPPILHPGNFCGSAITSLAFDQVTPDVVYLQDRCDLFRSTDGGIYWDPVTAPFQISYGAVTHPSRADTLYAITYSGTYATTDGGNTWNLILPNPAGNPPRVFVIDPANPNTLLTEFARSLDGGATWMPLVLGRAPNAIVFDPAQPGRAVAATSGASAGFLARFDSAGTLLAATYLGGQGGASINGVATDSAGNIYVAGIANSFDFATTRNALQVAPPNTIHNYFAAKFDSNLRLIYSTYLPGFTIITGIAVDPSGSAVIAGMAAPGAPGSGPPFRCFATKLAPDASGIVFSIIFGGSSGDTCSAVAADSAGNTIIAGQTSSPDFPLAGNGTQTRRQGYTNAILTKLDPAGHLVYSGYLGGGDRDSASAVAVDAAGNIYVAGTTSSKDFPTTSGAYQTALASNCVYPSSAVATGFIGTIFSYNTDDAFVTKFDPNGNLIFSTYLGAGCYDTAHSMAVDPLGNVWIAGSSDSNPFPQVEPFESGPAYTGYKPFVSELDAGGGSLKLSSYITGASVIAVDTFGNAYLGGSITSPPLTPYSVHASVAKVQPQFPAPIVINSAGNAFALRDGPVSPGQITQISAAALVPPNPQDLTFAPSAPLPRTLAETQVLFDGEPAALVSVTAGRVVAIAPYDLAGKRQTSIQVVFQSVASAPILADVLPDRGYLSQDGSGTGQAYARNPDGTLNSPQNPAPRGSMVTVYLTGIGVADPACPEGSVAAAATVPPLPNDTGVTSVAGSVCGLFQTAIRAPTFGPITANVVNSVLTIAVK